LAYPKQTAKGEMKVIILLGGYGTRMRPHAWSRPKPLLQVAHNTVVGHILDQMREVTTEEVILVVGYKGEQIRDWVEAHYSHLDLHFVTQHEARGQAHALWLCRDLLQTGGEVVVTLGDIIIDADFAGIAAGVPSEATAVFQVMEIDDPRQFGVVRLDEQGFISQIIEKPATGSYTQALAGVYWFRDGRPLWQTVDETLATERQTNGEYYLADAFQLMLERGAQIAVQPIRSIVDVGSPQNRLNANRRLLENWAGAPNRQTTGCNLIIPPVYIHPTAAISTSVVGPYVTIGRDVCLDHVIIQNSIVDEGATVRKIILADSLVGERVQLSGQAQTAVIGDDSMVYHKLEN
jgi:glucose-1-phosphate thymidylyltransferase